MFGVWHFFVAGPSGQPGVIAVSGRIEGDDSAVAVKTAGRIREITVREGDHVAAGQVIAAVYRPEPYPGIAPSAGTAHAARPG